MYKSLLIALLASTALARPQHGHKVHKHPHFTLSGSAPVATGISPPYGTANSTSPYTNCTGSSAPVSPPISTIAPVTNYITKTVKPLPVTESGSPIAPVKNAVNSGADVDSPAKVAPQVTTCDGSRSTTTVTSTELVTVTVEAGGAPAPSTPAPEVPPTSSSSSSSAIDSVIPAAGGAAGAFYPKSSPVKAGTAPSTSAEAVLPLPSATVPYPTDSSKAVSVPSATASSDAGTATGSKRGLAYNDASLTNLFSKKPVSWAYNWDSSAGGSLGSGLEYIPMMWCPTKGSLEAWSNKAAAAIASGSRHVLSFNEPDQPGQCDISPSDAAAGHIKYMNPLAGKAAIGSPAVTNGGGSMGLNYMQNFFDNCDGQCKVDFMNVHWYGDYHDGVVDNFKNHVTQSVQVAQKNGVNKIWITEFALNGASPENTASFLGEVLPWLDQQDKVERYAYFWCADGYLTIGNAISQVVGAAYLS